MFNRLNRLLDHLSVCIGVPGHRQRIQAIKQYRRHFTTYKIGSPRLS